MIDRIIIKPEIRSRIAESVEAALRLSQGLVIASIDHGGEWADVTFSEKFACPDHPEVSLPELEPRLFSFNSPHGACPTCHGLGTTLEYDPNAVIPDDTASLETGAVEAWRNFGKRFNIYYARVLRTFARDFGVSYTLPVAQMNEEVKHVLLYGSADENTVAKYKATEDSGKTFFEGVIPHLKRRSLRKHRERVGKTEAHHLHERTPLRCLPRPEATAECPGGTTGTEKISRPAAK